jgi:hypothetical protein
MPDSVRLVIFILESQDFQSIETDIRRRDVWNALYATCFVKPGFEDSYHELRQFHGSKGKGRSSPFDFPSERGGAPAPSPPLRSGLDAGTPPTAQRSTQGDSRSEFESADQVDGDACLPPLEAAANSKQPSSGRADCPSELADIISLLQTQNAGADVDRNMREGHAPSAANQQKGKT